MIPSMQHSFFRHEVIDSRVRDEETDGKEQKPNLASSVSEMYSSLMDPPLLSYQRKTLSRLRLGPQVPA